MCRLKGQRSRSQGFQQSVMVSFENFGDRLLDISNGHKNRCVHIIFLLKFCSSLYLHSVQEHSGCALITATRDSMVAACNLKNVVDMAAHKKQGQRQSYGQSQGQMIYFCRINGHKQDLLMMYFGWQISSNGRVLALLV